MERLGNEIPSCTTVSVPRPVIDLERKKKNWLCQFTGWMERSHTFHRTILLNPLWGVMSGKRKDQFKSKDSNHKIRDGLKGIHSERIGTNRLLQRMGCFQGQVRFEVRLTSTARDRPSQSFCKHDTSTSNTLRVWINDRARSFSSCFGSLFLLIISPILLWQDLMSPDIEASEHVSKTTRSREPIDGI